MLQARVRVRLGIPSGGGVLNSHLVGSSGCLHLKTFRVALNLSLAEPELDRFINTWFLGFSLGLGRGGLRDGPRKGTGGPPGRLAEGFGG